MKIEDGNEETLGHSRRLSKNVKTDALDRAPISDELFRAEKKSQSGIDNERSQKTFATNKRVGRNRESITGAELGMNDQPTQEGRDRS